MTVETTSLCRDCLQPVTAEIYETEGGLYLAKECKLHGIQTVLIERSHDAWAFMHTMQDPVPWKTRFNVCMVPVTDRCNIRCPHCYHMPGHKPDPSITEIMDVVERVEGGRSIILMGAEPTLRDDLPRIVANIRKTGRHVHIYTNGLRMNDDHYIRRLMAANLNAVCFSLHTKGYVKGWETKLAALEAMARHNVYIDHISFTMRTVDDLTEILDSAAAYQDRVHHFRIRIPSKIGLCRDESFFLSDFLPILHDCCAARNWPCELMPADNNPYHLMFNLSGNTFRVIRWPSIDEVDLGELNTPPTCMFVPDIGEVNFVHGALVQEARKLMGSVH